MHCKPIISVLNNARNNLSVILLLRATRTCCVFPFVTHLASMEADIIAFAIYNERGRVQERSMQTQSKAEVVIPHSGGIFTLLLLR